MTDEIKIWAIDGSSREAVAVEATRRTETEQLLEDVLVANPEMLLPDLALVGRQTPTAGGYLDLLGVDQQGQLVVFELKRGRVTRDAVTQVIDYCSALDSMSDSELIEHITERSGHSGIDQIEDMEDWYSQRFKGEVESLRPIRMALVGIGADDDATRMVSYLRRQGIDISLLTFFGYEYGGATLLAKHAEEQLASDYAAQSTGGSPSPSESLRQLDQHAASLGIPDLWEAAKSLLHTPAAGWSPTTRLKGLTFYMPALPMDELEDAKAAHGSHSVRLDSSGRIRITFYPAAVELCYDKFVGRQQSIPFHYEPPPNAPTTKRVQEQWYCLLDEEEWKEHQDALVELARAVNDAWLDRLQA